MSQPAPGPADTSPAALLALTGAQVLVRGWLSANNIVFRASGPGDGGASLVDTGYHSHAAQTLALIEHALAGQPLAQVINTHLHSDHCGGNAPLARRWPGLRIGVPAGCRDQLLPWNEDRLSYRSTGQSCEPFVPSHFLAAGEQVRLGPCNWQVFAAPGHDPDALMLFEPRSRTLISGDALWEQRLAIIFPELVGEPGFEAAHRALDCIEALAPARVLPGHGQPFCNVAAAIAASRQRLEAFAAAPQKHRQHAARALVSYHMLEHRVRPRKALLRWIVETPIFGQALQCGHDAELAQALAGETLDRLLADGVLIAEGDQVRLAAGG